MRLIFKVFFSSIQLSYIWLSYGQNLPKIALIKLYRRINFKIRKSYLLLVQITIVFWILPIKKKTKKNQTNLLGFTRLEEVYQLQSSKKPPLGPHDSVTGCYFVRCWGKLWREGEGELNKAKISSYIEKLTPLKITTTKQSIVTLHESQRLATICT